MAKLQFKRLLETERKTYLCNTGVLHHWISCSHEFQIWKLQNAIRHVEYYQKKNIFLFTFWKYRMNRISSRLGVYILPNTFDWGLRIWHYGSIMVNGNARIGRNCQLHGMNCIGNKGGDSNKAPTIGDNVDIGVGAVIIGDIVIANNVTIGANAVVTKSCNEENAILAGNPAVIIGYRK